MAWWTPEYIPPPEDLSRLNPIQRYLQKGSLDRQDYIRLFAVVLLYWFLRPYIQKILKRLSGSEQEGETERDAYKERRQQAKVNPNDIRVHKEKGDSRTLGNLLEGDAKTSGSKVDEQSDATRVKNRKKATSSAPDKSEVDKLLDWDDEPERNTVEGDKGNVMDWLDKWDK